MSPSSLLYLGMIMPEDEYNDLLGGCSIWKTKDLEAAKPPPPSIPKDIIVTDPQGNSKSILANLDVIIASSAKAKANANANKYKPTPRPTSTRRIPSHWYAKPCPAAQFSGGVAPNEIIDRPDNDLAYVRSGKNDLWYRWHDGEATAEMMTQEEYEDLLSWFGSLKLEEQMLEQKANVVQVQVLMPPVILVN
ncbi:hypothetical protein B0T20DRAFT_487261 [Sordaria brevicollis]|uniref:Uncharacterized protein n=1 Tax=Sordaria brevicollis TaxID=83679 RepID=A0AAE0U9I4_SORBR|nr:hypothetical protein B0T20DRAFT_487261 [Sordaria brevicollis]